MYTTIIHPVRKALNISCNEYIILDQIWRLSHTEKYGGWCVASKAKIGEWMDLSPRTVFTAIEVLLKKELITKNERGFLKTTDAWNEQMANSHNWLIAFEGKETKYISGKMPPKLGYAESAESMQNLQKTYAESAESPMQNLHITIRDNIKKTNTNESRTSDSTYQLRSEQDIFNYFNEVCETNLKLSVKKTAQIRARLKNFTKEEIKQAIKNRISDPWYAGNNENKKIWYKDWDSLFRNDEKIERALSLQSVVKKEKPFTPYIV